MTKNEILDQLTDLFRDIFDNADLVLTMSSSADDVDGWDSVTHINLIVAAEIHFGIKFKAAELDEMKNVGELVDLIYKKVPLS